MANQHPTKSEEEIARVMYHALNTLKQKTGLTVPEIVTQANIEPTEATNLQNHQNVRLHTLKRLATATGTTLKIEFI